MAIQKQGVNFNFAQGLDTKTDKKQVQAGKLLELENAVFDETGLFKKRNGFKNKTELPVEGSTTLNTFNDSLIATGSTLQVYSEDLGKWLPQGRPTPVSLSAQAISRSSLNQTQVDAARASNGQICVVYYEGTQAYYQISDGTNGQSAQAPVALPAVTTSARVFTLGAYYIITFLTTVVSSTQLQYIAVPIQNPASPTAPTTIHSTVGSLTSGYDGVVLQNNLYYAAYDVAGNITYGFVTNTLALSSKKNTSTGAAADYIAMAVSAGPGILWIAWHEVASTSIQIIGLDANLGTLITQTALPNVDSAVNKLVLAANDTSATAITQNTNTVAALANTRQDVTRTVSISSTGVSGTSATVNRALGIASKPCYIGDTLYFLAVYNGPYQPTYFLSTVSGKIVGKLAYSNGAGYNTLSQVVPTITLVDNTLFVPYLYKVLVSPINKAQGATATEGTYAQTGVNLAYFDFASSQLAAETAKSLHLTGGVLWQYDGVNTVEHGFHLWPENVTATISSTTGGNLSAQVYYYQAIYEWTDAAGNLHRSAPSLPVKITIVTANSQVQISVPTLQVTDKQNVRILIYRWSAAQQNYYQITSVAAPVLNSKSTEFITFTDTQADSAIIGNSLIYTTGGVVENIGAPACAAITLYGNRVWLLSAEDKNLLWYSKEIAQSTPIEFSDLFTQYAAPVSNSKETEAIQEMDDKLIVFKPDAMAYLTGRGPNNTGADNDYAAPVDITAPVGSSNPKSIVRTPLGLMFQSNKGIWLLGRDLSSKFIGAPVAKYNSDQVTSAILVPGTNQVRFSLASGTVLVYDYYVDQWGTFKGAGSLSSCIYQGYHTILTQYGQVRQETPGFYLDGSSPVLLSFRTAWLKMAGLQGFQRAYHFFLLSNYLTPHKLNVNISYDYNSSAEQSTIIYPTNYSPSWGDLELWGSGDVWGGPSDVEQWRIFLDKQKCQAIQVQVQEIYDPAYGVPAGAGLTFSGLNMVVGGKLSYPKPPTSGSVS